jgi:hypothetical protein
MAGQQILDLLIGVRVPGGQPASSLRQFLLSPLLRSQAEKQRWGTFGRQTRSPNPKDKLPQWPLFAAFSWSGRSSWAKPTAVEVVTFSEQARNGRSFVQPSALTINFFQLCSKTYPEGTTMKRLPQVLLLAATVAVSLASFADQPGRFSKVNAALDEPGPFPKLTVKADEPGPFPKLTVKADEPGPFPKLSVLADEPGPFPK